MKKRKFWVSLVAGLLAASMVLGLIAGLISSAAAASSSEIQSQIDALEEEKSQLQENIDALEQQQTDNLSEMEDIVNQKNAIDQQITLLFQKMENINDQIDAYNQLIADTQEKLDQAETRFEELNIQNKQRIRTMEEEGELSYWSVLFQANSFADFLDRLNMVEEIASADQKRLEELSQAAQLVNEVRDSLTAEKADLESTKEELTLAQAELEAKRAEADSLLESLIAKGEEFEALIEEGEMAVEDLLTEIAQQEKELNEAKEKEYQQWLSTSVPETTAGSTGSTGSTSNPSSSGEWIVPCEYVYFASPFNPNRLHPILGYARPHNGVDLAAYHGTPVVATRSGTVTTATTGYEAGNYVTINHGDGFSSVYMHLYYYIVSPGEYVDAGEVIGYVGTTGLSEGPHLHFGVMYNGTYVNPANYMNFHP